VDSARRLHSHNQRFTEKRHEMALSAFILAGAGWTWGKGVTQSVAQVAFHLHSFSIGRGTRGS
jgi:hypothetical protein